MRMILFTLAFCIGLSSLAVAQPVQSDRPSRVEASAGFSKDAWRGREHFLYDDDFTAKTDGAETAARNACAKKLARVKGSDGKTAIERINKCD